MSLEILSWLDDLVRDLQKYDELQKRLFLLEEIEVTGTSRGFIQVIPSETSMSAVLCLPYCSIMVEGEACSPSVRKMDRHVFYDTLFLFPDIASRTNYFKTYYHLVKDYPENFMSWVHGPLPGSGGRERVLAQVHKLAALKYLSESCYIRSP
jgi:hypothetical protein